MEQSIENKNTNSNNEKIPYSVFIILIIVLIWSSLKFISAIVIIIIYTPLIFPFQSYYHVFVLYIIFASANIINIISIIYALVHYTLHNNNRTLERDTYHIIGLLAVCLMFINPILDVAVCIKSWMSNFDLNFVFKIHSLSNIVLNFIAITAFIIFLVFQKVSKNKFFNCRVENHSNSQPIVEDIVA